MSKRPKQVSLFLDAAQFASSEEIDFHVWFSPDTKFIIGFDFAVTLSSPESFSVLFDITSEQYEELKWLILNKHKKMIPFIEVSLGQYV